VYQSDGLTVEVVLGRELSHQRDSKIWYHYDCRWTVANKQSDIRRSTAKQDINATPVVRIDEVLRLRSAFLPVAPATKQRVRIEVVQASA